jgi:hypothetical protein
MSSPLSAYDLLYKGLNDEDREKLHCDLAKLLKDSAEEANKHLILGVQKAATEIYQHLIANPWPTILIENAGQYGFIESLANDIWEKMLKSDPKDLNKYKWSMKELVEKWKENYPEEFKQVIEEKLIDENRVLKERVKFLEGMCSARYL